MIKEQIIYGVHAVLAMLRERGQTVAEVLVARGSRGQWFNEVKALAQQHGVRFRVTDPLQVQRLAGSGKHQGIVARTMGYEYTDFAEVERRLQEAGPQALALVLDCLQDPMNFGNCLRSAAAVGVQGVIIPKDRAVGVSASVAKAAAGALALVPVCRVTNLATSLHRLKESGLWLIGAEASAPQPLYAADLRGPVALVIGSEGRGLRPRVRQACDLLLHIPMATDSLGSFNAATATGIFLYEIMRQRRIQEKLT